MTNGIIHLEYDDFCQRFLSHPSRISRTKRMRSNYFKALQNADDITPQELSRTFVSQSGPNVGSVADEDNS